MSKFLRRALMGTAVAAASMAAAAQAQSVLRMVPQADLRILDPVWTTVTITNNYARMIYDTLYSMDADFRPQPQMVESHTLSDDKLTWRFTLRQGLKFHDGSPVTSKDAIVSLKRWAVRSVDGKVMMSRTASIEPDGDRSFVIKLKQPYGFMLDTLGGAANTMFVMREKDALTDAFQEVKDSVGSGPFRFVREEWVPGVKTVFVKNKDYVPRSEAANGQAGGKVVKVDRVVWTYIPDPSTAVAALQRDEMDMVETVTHDLIPLLAKDRNIQLIILDPIGFQGTIRPNATVAPFNNPKARQALLYLGDQRDYLNAMIGDEDRYKRVCHSPFICGSPSESAAGLTPGDRPNREKAKQLLAEAGYKGEPIVVMTPTDQQLIHTMTLVTAQMLREIGVNVDLQAMDWGTMTQRRVNKNEPSKDRAGWHIGQTTWPGRIQQNPFANLFASTSCDGRNAWGFPCDDEFEKLRLSYLDAQTAEERKKIVDTLQVKFFEVVPFVPVGQFTRPVAYRRSLQGIVAPSWDLALWNIEKK